MQIRGIQETDSYNAGNMDPLGKDEEVVNDDSSDFDDGRDLAKLVADGSSEPPTIDDPRLTGIDSNNQTVVQ